MKGKETCGRTDVSLLPLSELARLLASSPSLPLFLYGKCSVLTQQTSAILLRDRRCQSHLLHFTSYTLKIECNVALNSLAHVLDSTHLAINLRRDRPTDRPTSDLYKSASFGFAPAVGTSTYPTAHPPTHNIDRPRSHLAAHRV